MCCSRTGRLGDLPAVCSLQLLFLCVDLAVRCVVLCFQNGEASLFEVNIRYIGGLLAAYYLTGEEVGVSSSVCHTVSKTELKGFAISFSLSMG